MPFTLNSSVIYEISNWHQLLGLKSTISDRIHIAVTTFRTDYSNCLVVSVFDSLEFNVLKSWVVAGTNDKRLRTDDIISGRDVVLSELKPFGFNVKWVENFVELSLQTKQFLNHIRYLGYTYIQKTSDENNIYVRAYSSNIPDLSEGMLCNEIATYGLCDFSNLDFGEIYNINNLIIQEVANQ